MVGRAFVFLVIGVLAGLAPGYLLGSGGWGVNEVAILVDEVRHQNRTLDYLLAEQESSFATSLTECRNVRTNLESQLEACLFDSVDRNRDAMLEPSADPAPRQLRGTDSFIETREYPAVPNGDPKPASPGR